MAVQDSDISWPVLRRIVHDWLGDQAELAEVTPLHGGCINTTLCLTTAAGEKAVLKISPHRVDRAYVQEAYQLNHLRQLGLPTPQVYICQLGSLDAPFSYLLMEFLPGMNLAQAKQQCDATQFDHLQMHLADLVLSMHEQKADGYARLTPDGDETFASWPAFYHSVYDTIWRETERGGLLPVKCRKLIAKIHDRLDRLIQHDDGPRLVHWDLWATNIMAGADAHGRWWITGLLDPYAKFAHAEAELAYLELFNTITPAFTRAYAQRRKLSPEYHRLRKHIYQLYPLIDHVHLFGQEYLKPLLATVEKLSALV